MLDWGVLLALVIVWGSAFAAVKTAVAELAPAWVVAARLWLGAATLAVMMIFQRERPPAISNPAWRWYAAIGILGTAVPFFLFAFAALDLPSAVLAIANGATPVFTALLAHAFVAAEPLTSRKAAGVGLGFLGVAVLVGPGLLAVLDQGTDAGAVTRTVALAAALLGAAGYALGNILTRKAPPVAATTGAFVFCICAAVVATPLALLQAGVPAPVSANAFWALLFLGVGSTGVASAGWVWLVVRRGSVFTSFATYLSPVWATLLGVALLGERPAWTAYAALVLILGGVAVASGTTRRGAGSR